MSSVIDDAERTYKAIMKLWESVQAEEWPDITPMSYQRFKVLRAVCEDKGTVPNITESSGLDRSTTAVMLHNLMEDGHITRGHIDQRAFRWSATDKGIKTVRRISDIFDKTREPMREIAKANMETWI